MLSGLGEAFFGKVGEGSVHEIGFVVSAHGVDEELHGSLEVVCLNAFLGGDLLYRAFEELLFAQFELGEFGALGGEGVGEALGNLALALEFVIEGGYLLLKLIDLYVKPIDAAAEFFFAGYRLE